MGLIGWLVAVGCMFIGAAIGIWGLTEFNKLIAIWAIGIPGAMLLVVAGGFELQKFFLENQKPKSTINDRRAYVFLNEGDVANPPGAPATISFSISNTGHTPAFDLTWRTQFNVAMVGFESKIALDNVTPVKQTLPAGKSLSYVFTFQTWDSKIDALLLEERAAIYAIGEIRYKDIDGIDRFTDYLFKSSGRFGNKAGGAPGKFSAVYLRSN